MNKFAKRLSAALLAAALLLSLAGCGTKDGKENTFTLQVTHGDGAAVTREVTTRKATLGEALTDEGIIDGEEGPYGLFVQTVDGETADEAQSQWWCLTKDGQSVSTGVDSTPVEDGATYALTLTRGY